MMILIKSLILKLISSINSDIEITDTEKINDGFFSSTLIMTTTVLKMNSKFQQILITMKKLFVFKRHTFQKQQQQQ